MMDGATQTVEQRPPTTTDERSAGGLAEGGLGMEGVEEGARVAGKAGLVPSRKRRGCEDGSEGEGGTEEGKRKKRRLGNGACGGELFSAS